jgi:hypothetical protein
VFSDGKKSLNGIVPSNKKKKLGTMGWVGKLVSFQKILCMATKNSEHEAPLKVPFVRIRFSSM